MNYIDLLIKDNRFVLNNYKKNPIFNNKIIKLNNKIKKKNKKRVRFKKNDYVYIIPNLVNVNKEELWWQGPDYKLFIKNYINNINII